MWVHNPVLGDNGTTLHTRGKLQGDKSPLFHFVTQCVQSVLYMLCKSISYLIHMYTYIHNSTSTYLRNQLYTYSVHNVCMHVCMSHVESHLTARHESFTLYLSSLVRSNNLKQRKVMSKQFLAQEIIRYWRPSWQRRLATYTYVSMV